MTVCRGLCCCAYAQALEFDPRNGHAYNNRSLLHLKLGDVVAATADMLRADELLGRAPTTAVTLKPPPEGHQPATGSP